MNSKTFWNVKDQKIVLEDGQNGNTTYQGTHNYNRLHVIVRILQMRREVNIWQVYDYTKYLEYRPFIPRPPKELPSGKPIKM